MATKKSNIYESKAVPKLIRATSRTSLKINDSFYTFEYQEEREFPQDLMIEGKIDLDKERELLWNEAHKQVDNQAEELYNLLKNGIKK